jgi:hypothetical protein
MAQKEISDCMVSGEGQSLVGKVGIAFLKNNKWCEYQCGIRTIIETVKANLAPFHYLMQLRMLV